MTEEPVVETTEVIVPKFDNLADPRNTDALIDLRIEAIKTYKKTHKNSASATEIFHRVQETKVNPNIQIIDAKYYSTSFELENRSPSAAFDYALYSAETLNSFSNEECNSLFSDVDSDSELHLLMREEQYVPVQRMTLDIGQETTLVSKYMCSPVFARRMHHIYKHGWPGGFKPLPHILEAWEKIYPPELFGAIRSPLNRQRNLEEFEEQKDFRKDLKNYWDDVFSIYWLASAKQSGDTAITNTGISDQLRERHDSSLMKIKTNLIGKPQTLAEISQQNSEIANNQMFLNQAQKQTQNKFNELVSEISGEEANSQLLREIGSQARLNIINQLQALKPTNGEVDLTQLLTNFKKLYSEKTLEQGFGKQFLDLDDVEQVCIISFNALAYNGVTVGQGRKAVENLQKYVLPQLEKPSLPKYANEEEKEFPPYDHDYYSRISQKALRRLESFTPEDPIVLNTHPWIIGELALRDEYLKETFQLKEIEKKIEIELKPDVFRKINNYFISPFVLPAFVAFTGLILKFSSFDSQSQNLFNYPATFILGACCLKLKSAAKRSIDLQTLGKGIKDKKKSEIQNPDVFSDPEETSQKIEKHIKKLKRPTNILKTILNVATVGAFLLGYSTLSENSSSENQIKYGDSHGISNNNEAPKVGNPDHFIYGGEKLYFSVGAACQMNPDSPISNCETLAGDESILSQNPSPKLEYKDKPELLKITNEQVAIGNIVRFNVDKDNQFMEHPVGHRIVGFIGPKDTDVEIVSYPTKGLNLYELPNGDFQPSNRVGMIFEPLPNPLSIPISDTFVVSEAPIKPEAFDQDNLKHLKPIYEHTKKLLADQPSIGVSNRQILTEIQTWIENQGIGYGFKAFDVSGTSNPTELLAKSMSIDSEGKYIYDSQDCDQLSTTIYLIAKSAGMKNIILLNGTMNDPNSGYGGYASQAHMLIGFQEVNQDWQIFEATLPSLDDRFEYPSLPDENTDFLSQPESLNLSKNEKALLLTLLATAGTFVVSKGVSEGKKRWKKRRRDIHNNLQELIKNTNETAGLNALETLYYIADYTDNKEKYDNWLNQHNLTFNEFLNQSLGSKSNDKNPIYWTTLESIKSSARNIKEEAKQGRQSAKRNKSALNQIKLRFNPNYQNEYLGYLKSLVNYNKANNQENSVEYQDSLRILELILKDSQID